MSIRTPESEVERLLRQWFPLSPFRSSAYIVGGYVRDEILGIAGKDIDLVVEQKGGAEALSRWLHEQNPQNISTPHPMGAGYPIWQIVFKDNILWKGETFYTAQCEVEIADTQSEAFPDPTTRQRITIFGNLEEDCRRRDFTVNMLYRDLTTGALVDPSGMGAKDIQAGILRGHPKVKLEKIFSDDPLRMLRLIRFHCRFQWLIPEDVLDCVKKCVFRVEILSAERVRDEIVKMCESGRFYLGLALMRETKLLQYIFPELVPMIGSTQDKIFHSEGDVWTHTLLVVKNAPPTTLLQLAALIHDAGKPATRSEHGDRIKFLGHETLSVEIAEKILRRLHFDSQTLKDVKQLISLHMRGGDVEKWTSLKPARKLLRDSGEQLENLVQLIEADSRSSFRSDGRYHIEHVQKLREVLASAQEIPMQHKGVLSGFEIMEALQLKPGKQVAEVKKFLEDLEDVYASGKKALSHDEALKAIKQHFPNSP